LNLNPQSLFVGQSVIFVQEIDSTNEYLKYFAKKSTLAEGTTVVTEHQTHGKGQHANKWESKPGENALFSVLLKPKDLAGEQINSLSFLTGLAVRATIQKYLPALEVKVKWPNDVMVADLKVAGILIENRISVHLESVIGIGINVNQNNFTNLPFATSLCAETKTDVDVSDVISHCLGFVEKYYLLSKRAGGLKQLHNLYVSQLYKLNEDIHVDQEVFSVKGVQMDGKLLVGNEIMEKAVAHKEAIIQWN
jgi:BirA family transcriptional regulator, biotin operon repressor / biotin---[acetyl-CoA-carboxylase] ligase